MTIAGKNSLSKGSARLLVRVNRSLNGPRIEWRSFYKVDARPINVLVEFNARDELELKFTTDKDDSKNNKENINSINTFDGRIIKIETFKIDEIIDCFANESGDFSNALIVEVLKKNLREEMVLQFESEQEFRRTLFTYKYFKMRNRLANSSSSEHSDGSASPSLSTKSKSSMSSIENGLSSPDYSGKVFDYSKNNNGTTSHYIKKFENINDLGSHQNYPSKSLDYMAINNIQRAKQNRSQEYNNKELKTRDFGEVGILNGKNSKSEYNLPQIIDKNKGFNNMTESKAGDKGEIDGLIYTDVEYESMEYPSMNYSNTKLTSSNAVEIPQKPQRRKQLLRRIKGKAPPPPGGGDSGWGGEQGRAQEPGKGTTVKISAERGERVPTKESDGFPLRINSQVPRAHMGASGYESDREEWRSRSTFSSSAFHSLARPARQALAVYYRLSSSPPAAQPPQPAPRKSSQRNQRNLQDYPKNFASPEYIIVGQIPNQEPKRTNNQQTFQQERIPYQKQQEQKYGKMLFNQEYKRNTLGGSMNYLNISNRLYGLTDKLKELGQNTQNRQQQWQVKPERKEKEKEKEKGTLKPVIKKSPPQEGSKRPVVRTCSAEPPKKVTFSAFATVQVV